ncbi:hypothetical protein J6590_011547 [Homalodisca vitripennis]|nr:hypothetical protein J6590_011547 [Homalodisca vitripennis]
MRWIEPLIAHCLATNQPLTGVKCAPLSTPPSRHDSWPSGGSNPGPRPLDSDLQKKVTSSVCQEGLLEMVKQFIPMIRHNL